jgi:alkylation response protein AidB-like acyl-CoA dehydrogenase
VKVPAKNLIGEENQGFKLIMLNFNHERFAVAVGCNRFARVCLEEAIKYAKVRKTFGKRLVDHPVIRLKIAEMIRQVEATHALLEQICYQMKQNVPDEKLGGIIAFAKVQTTKVFEFCAREASQILGGASCIRGGPGEKIERLYREVRINTFGGGSEEVLLDLGVRRAKL